MRIRHKYISVHCTWLPPHTRCHQCSSYPPSLLKSHQHWHFICDRHFWNHINADTSYVTVISEITPTLILIRMGWSVVSHFWNHTNTDVTVTSEITPTPILHIGWSVICHLWNHTNIDTLYRTVCHQSLLKSHQHWLILIHIERLVISELLTDRFFWNHTSTDT